MKFFIKTVFSTLVALLSLTSFLHADEPLITIKKSDTISVSFTGFTGPNAGILSKILENDLNLSGILRLEPSNKAIATISGISTGGSLQGRLIDHSSNLILDQTYHGDDSAMIHQFVNDILEKLTGSRGISMSKIAFVSNRTGRKEIYTADYDGTHVKQITHDQGICVSPSLSPHGNSLAYTGYLSGYADIYLIDLVSGKRERLIKFPGTNSGPRFSPDGDHLTCTLSKDGHPGLYIANLSGGVQRLTRTRGAESSGTWSPQGNELIYVSDERGAPQLYRMSTQGGNGILLSTGFGYATEPNWSPNGELVAFNTRSNGTFSIAILDLKTGSSKIVAQGENPVWGPDSRHLLFSNKNSLLILDVPTGKLTPIITNLKEVTEPTWSRF